MPSGVEHYYYCTKGDRRSWWIYFEGYGVPEILESFGFNKPSAYTLGSPDELLRMLRQIYSAIVNDKVFGNYDASAYLYHFIMEFYKCTELPAGNSKTYSSISAAVELIEKEYHNKITMDMLCCAAHLSESHFCRTFKSQFGICQSCPHSKSQGAAFANVYVN